jgi:hypothetical protein
MAVTKSEKTVPKDEKTELIRQLNEEGHEDYCGIDLKDLTTGELKTLLKEVTEGTLQGHCNGRDFQPQPPVPSGDRKRSWRNRHGGNDEGQTAPEHRSSSSRAVG